MPTSERCLSVCQRYNLKANHNGQDNTALLAQGVYQCVKDTIWKQITTLQTRVLSLARVFISVSKIQFESKSQLAISLNLCGARCLSVCQRYNLKANHNLKHLLNGLSKGVYQCVKDTIWKQITTSSPYSCIVFWCLSVCQRYNLKANHNNSLKIEEHGIGVYQCVKDTIWKQITTEPIKVSNLVKVFISVSKIQFESKSQHNPFNIVKTNRCLSVCQRYNLKANHN